MNQKTLKNTMLVILISILAISNTYAQEVPSIKKDIETQKFIYTEVVQVEGSKNDLYDRCVTWFNSFYKNVMNVTKRLSKTEGVIDGSHRFKIYDTNDKGVQIDAGNVAYDILFNFRDGRYKYTITNIRWLQTSNFPAEKWEDKKAPSYSHKYDNYLIQTETKIQEIIADMKKGMQPKAVKVEEEW